MNFSEVSRSDTTNGSTIVYSKAYVALGRFESAYINHQAKEALLLDLQRELYAAKKDMEQKSAELLDAIAEHYQGEEFPPAMQSSLGTLIFPDADSEHSTIEVIKTTSYCDLYRVENQPAQEAA